MSSNLAHFEGSSILAELVDRLILGGDIGMDSQRVEPTTTTAVRGLQELHL